MISIKAITSSFLAIAFCFSLSVSGSAERLESIGNELYSDHEGFDTLSLTQAEYENLVSINHVGVTTNAYVNDSIELSDIQIIEEICKVHIATSRAYVRDPDNYSKTTFFSPEANDNQLVKNHISQYDYLNSLYEAKDWTVYSDNLSFSEYNVEINGDYANASIVEEYSYDINNGFDELCWLSREYSITLRKSLGNWYITCITTDSPIEREEIDIEVQIALIDHPVEAPSILDDLSTHSNIVPMSSSLYSWLYNAEDAIEYAKTYYKNANPLFGENDSDCQNFVSQCVWAGLGGTSISDVPCVSYDLVGHNATNLWCHNQYSNYYSNYKYNWAWDNVVGFFHLIVMSSTNSIGPYGVTHVSNALNYANAGDQLFVDLDGGSANGTNIDHAMFITKVNGTSGSRTSTNIFIAAHNNSTTSAYQPLSDYIATVPIQSYARTFISGGYYPTPQP